jgi:hypothetical protein
MLQIDAQGIKTLACHDLGGETMGHGKPAQRHALAVSPHLLDLVRSHGHTSILFIDPTNGSRSINSKRARESIEATLTPLGCEATREQHVRDREPTSP